jgi:hypothetical protein
MKPNHFFFAGADVFADVGLFGRNFSAIERKGGSL